MSSFSFLNVYLVLLILTELMGIENPNLKFIAQFDYNKTGENRFSMKISIFFFTRKFITHQNNLGTEELYTFY